MKALCGCICGLKPLAANIWLALTHGIIPTASLRTHSAQPGCINCGGRGYTWHGPAGAADSISDRLSGVQCCQPFLEGMASAR
jgi:hypothetical protein